MTSQLELLMASALACNARIIDHLISKMQHKQTRRKKDWNLYLTDDAKFRLSKAEILEKKKLLTSKYNTLKNPPLPQDKVHTNWTLSDHLNVARTAKKSPKQHNASEFNGNPVSPSPSLTYNSSSIGTTQAGESDDDHEDGDSIDEGIINRRNNNNKNDFSSLDLLEKDAGDADDYYEEEHHEAPINLSVNISPRNKKSRFSSRKRHESMKKDDTLKRDIQNRTVAKSPITQGTSRNMFKEGSPMNMKKTISPNDKVDDDDDDEYLKCMVEEIATLRKELLYYEELSGKKKILDTEVFYKLHSRDLC